MLMLDHILQSTENAQLVLEPFPCLVFDEFIDDESSRLLTATMPEHTPFYQAPQVLANESPLWREYIASINNPIFQVHLMNRLGSKIKPQIHEVGLRGRDTESKYVTASYMAIRDPAPQNRIEGFPPGGGWDDWLLYPHVDSHFAITSMVHFFRREDDEDDSGPLLILKKKCESPRLIDTPSIIPYANPEDFEIIHTFPYRRNFAAAMLCGPEQWHAIGPRYKNVRRSVNMSIEWSNSGARKISQMPMPPPYAHKLTAD